MSNRLYAGAVIVFWLASMTWLVTERILPPFFGGQAPMSTVSHQVEPVAWRIGMEGQQSGVAVLQAVPVGGGTKEVHSVLKLDKVPVPAGAPLWLRPLLASMKGGLSLHMRTRTTYDALDRLAAFDTDMMVNRLDKKIEMAGRVEDDLLKLRVRVGGITKKFEHPWPQDATLSGEFTPAARLLPLYEGRRWRHDVYSPFSSPKEPIEMIEAVVESRFRPTINGVARDAWRVEYRSMDKIGSTDKGRLRAVLTVADDGRVLRQEVSVLGSTVTFVREDAERSAELAGELLELSDRATVYPTSRAMAPRRPGDTPVAAAAGDAGKATQAN